MAGNGPQGAAARATFGDELRREREIRGISLREIAEATKVSRRFLEAIERDDHKHLPAPVFARGFVREYARYLGLDSEEMVNRYIHYTHSLHDPELEEFPEPLRSDRPTLEREIPRPYARVDRRVWILLALVLICIGAIIGVRAWIVTRDGGAPAATPAPALEPVPATTQPSTPEPLVDPDHADTTATPSLLVLAPGYDGAAPS